METVDKRGDCQHCNHHEGHIQVNPACPAHGQRPIYGPCDSEGKPVIYMYPEGNRANTWTVKDAQGVFSTGNTQLEAHETVQRLRKAAKAN